MTLKMMQCCEWPKVISVLIRDNLSQYHSFGYFPNAPLEKQVFPAGTLRNLFLYYQSDTLTPRYIQQLCWMQWRRQTFIYLFLAFVLNLNLIRHFYWSSIYMSEHQDFIYARSQSSKNNNVMNKETWAFKFMFLCQV
jgi:hypothetical protein